MKVEGLFVDLFKREIYPSEVCISKGRIKYVKRKAKASGKEYPFIMPGLIDAHIHIESSMCTPGAFAAAAVSRGTTGVVSDPHEIANVLGIQGVNFMIEDAEKVPLKFWFGAPSCVPATSFETAGASVGEEETEKLMKRNEIKYLAEMMNYPGVIYGDKIVLGKISIAKKSGKPIDGHAPGLTGENLKKYIEAGISTDHECSSAEEAKEKLKYGMKIIIREGSAARNLDALKSIIRTNPEMTMLCSDDLHPEMLINGHINRLIKKLIAEGYDIFDVLKCCTYNPAKHYKLDAGLLRSGDPADFILVDTLENMEVLETWINGSKVYERGKILFDYKGAELVNNFNSSFITADDIKVKNNSGKIRIIEASDGELLTRQIFEEPGAGSYIEADTVRDILKIVVKDRYNDKPPAVGFIKGFGLKKGAFAGSVAHDSHNIICIGTNDDDIVSAVNEIVKAKGGFAVADGSNNKVIPLPVAGIMSDKPVHSIAKDYNYASDMVKSLGCRLSSPFMTLSFMALLVIPEIKISDRGLFDGKEFRFVSLFV